jgi:hypothetical protein
MLKPAASLLFGFILALSACQPSPPATETTTATEAPAAPAEAPATGAPTEADARVAVGRYVQSQPNAALFVVDSASVVDVDTHWQVLVPRTDWAGRMPNRAHFEVDKASGTVSTGTVK